MTAAVVVRSGPQLIHALASRVRAGRPMTDALNDVLRGEPGHRYRNLAADVAVALGLAPASWCDREAYGQRLALWAAQIGPRAAAERLDQLASEMARELARCLSGKAVTR